MEEIVQDCVFLLIVDRIGRRPLGFVHSYGASPEDGFVHFVLYAEPSARGTGMGVEAAILFGDYLFKFFAIRKLYAEVYEFNEDSIDVLLNAGFLREGVLKEHLWYDDRYWDMHQLALYRRDWELLKQRMDRLFETARKRKRTERSYLSNGSLSNP